MTTAIIAMIAATIAAIAAIHAAFFALRAVWLCSIWEASLRRRASSSFSASQAVSLAKISAFVVPDDVELVPDEIPLHFRSEHTSRGSYWVVLPRTQSLRLGTLDSLRP